MAQDEGAQQQQQQQQKQKQLQQPQQQPGKKPLARLLDVVVNHSGVVTVLLVAYGVLGFALLPAMDRRIKFDENALLAGSARPTLRIQSPDALARGMELGQEADRVYQTAAYGSWLQHKLQTLGLEIYNHSYSTAWPYGRQQATNCTNVHAVLRAPRGDGKEAILLVTPIALQPIQRDLKQTRSGASLALSLGSALMLHLQRVPWLAKDIIWVIPDASCGLVDSMTAWVQAYQSPASSNAAQSPGQDLSHFGRAGVMQQAIVLESTQVPFDAVELLLDGHDGQLPKLDMYWLLKYYATNWIRAPVFLHNQHASGLLVERLVPLWGRAYVHKLATLAQFGWRQARGLPLGAHAAFKACGVDAATMRLTRHAVAGAEAVDARAAQRQLGDLLELSVRSCNALIEKFHHSFFLYLQSGTESFVTIEQYITPLAAMVLSLLLQAAAVKRAADNLLGTAPGLHELAASQAQWHASARTLLVAHALCAAAGYCLRRTLESAQLSVVALVRLGVELLQSPGQHVDALGLCAGAVLFALLVCGEVGTVWTWPLSAGSLHKSKLASKQQQHGQKCDGAQVSHAANGHVATSSGALQPPAELIDWRKLKVLMLSGTAAVLAAVACVNWALAYAICLAIMPLTTCCSWRGHQRHRQPQQGEQQQANNKAALQRTWQPSQITSIIACGVCSPPVVLICLYLLSGHSPGRLLQWQELRWLVLESRVTTYMLCWAVFVPFWVLSICIGLSH